MMMNSVRIRIIRLPASSFRMRHAIQLDLTLGSRSANIAMLAV